MIQPAADGRGHVYTKVFTCGHTQLFYLHRSEVVYNRDKTQVVKPVKDLSLKCKVCSA